LKIGIHHDLRTELPDEAGKGLCQAMRYYTNSMAYHRATIAGGNRVDLQGRPAGTVTEEQHRHAVKELAKIKARRAAQKAAQGAQSQSKAQRQGQVGRGRKTAPGAAGADCG
jgi:sRNA-binding protein